MEYNKVGNKRKQDDIDDLSIDVFNEKFNKLSQKAKEIFIKEAFTPFHIENAG